MLERMAVAEWLASTGDGYCAATSPHPANCATDSKGSFKLKLKGSSAESEEHNWILAASYCLSLCAACQNCRHITVSLQHRDCSWYRECNELYTDLGGGLFKSGALSEFNSTPHVQQSATRHAWRGPDDWDASLYEHVAPPKPSALHFERPADRFAPRTLEQAMAAVFTTWNMLDRMVLDPANRIVPWAFGMFLPVQVEKLVRAVRSPGVETYCEVTPRA